MPAITPKDRQSYRVIELLINPKCAYQALFLGGSRNRKIWIVIKSTVSSLGRQKQKGVVTYTSQKLARLPVQSHLSIRFFINNYSY